MSFQPHLLDNMGVPFHCLWLATGGVRCELYNEEGQIISSGVGSTIDSAKTAALQSLEKESRVMTLKQQIEANVLKALKENEEKLRRDQEARAQEERIFAGKVEQAFAQCSQVLLTHTGNPEKLLARTEVIQGARYSRVRVISLDQKDQRLLAALEARFRIEDLQTDMIPGGDERQTFLELYVLLPLPAVPRALNYGEPRLP